MKFKMFTTFLTLQVFLAVVPTSLANKIEWKKVRPDEIPFSTQYPVGKDAYTDFYLCRSKWNGWQYSGKLYISTYMQPSCLFGLEGKEIYGEDYEILSYPPGSVSWEVFNGNLPDMAIPAGNIIGDKATFVCRGWFDTNIFSILNTGYYDPVSRKCHVGEKREEHTMDGSFEIMVKNKLGVLLNY